MRSEIVSGGIWIADKPRPTRTTGGTGCVGFSCAGLARRLLRVRVRAYVRTHGNRPCQKSRVVPVVSVVPVAVLVRVRVRNRRRENTPERQQPRPGAA